LTIRDYEAMLERDEDTLATTEKSGVTKENPETGTLRPGTVKVAMPGPRSVQLQNVPLAKNPGSIRKNTAPAACTGGYPNVPPRLEDMAEAVSIRVVRKRTHDIAGGTSATLSEQHVNEEFETHYNELVFLSIADALFTDTQKINLRKLTWQEFSAETARTDKQTGA